MCHQCVSVLVWPFSFEQDQYLCYSVQFSQKTLVLHPPTCIESDHGVLVARSSIVQEEQRASLSRVCRSVRSSQTLMLSHTSSIPSSFCVELWNPFFCLSGLRQSVQPAGHPTHRRHELQDTQRSLNIRNVFFQIKSFGTKLLPRDFIYHPHFCVA